MEYDTFRYDDPYGYAKKRVNVFGWSVLILLCLGLTFAAWIGSFYIFGQPERPESYRILKKLKKVEPPRRFELTAAPAGEFLTARQIYDRLIALRTGELAKLNAELARNYIRNFTQVRGLVPYVIGRFNIMESRELRPDDIFGSGVVALARSVDVPEVLLEHVYTAGPRDVPFLKRTLVMGLDVRLERTHDLSALIHAERLADGRLQLTAIPLLYGSYTVTRGTGTFSLEPPADLNLAAGWPVFKENARRLADTHYDSYRERVAPAVGGVPIAGAQPAAATPAPMNELVRLEPAVPLDAPKIAAVGPAGKNAKGPTKAATPLPKGAKPPKNQPTPPPAAMPEPAPPIIAMNTPPPPPASTPAPVASPSAAETPITIAKAIPVASVLPSLAPTTSPEPQVLPAIPVLTPSPGLALASTAGANWKTYPAGRMPIGRVVTPGELKEVADAGAVSERMYLKGQFVVNFADGNRAVLRPRNKLTDTVLHFGRGQSSTRIVVEFPNGSALPAKGATVTRDDARPYEITEVRRQEDGQLNVFVREIIAP